MIGSGSEVCFIRLNCIEMMLHYVHEVRVHWKCCTVRFMRSNVVRVSEK